MKLGIDIGTFSLKIVLLDEDNQIVYKAIKKHNNKIQNTITQMLKDVDCDNFELGICGNMCHLLGIDDKYIFNELIALCNAKDKLHPNAKGIIHLGAQKTYYVDFDNNNKPSIYKNSNCSSGTGSFFEEQAGRLEIPLESISDIVANATLIPHIAGRCSVFSKTDIIHKMQEGVKSADLLNGLCYALVRNFKSNVLKNQTPQVPVILSGGVMNNKGVVNALKDLLELNDNDIIFDYNSDFYCALGCGYMANNIISKEELLNSIDNISRSPVVSSLPPLYKFKKDSDKFDFSAYDFKSGKAYLGIDVGSTSINLVLINEDKEPEYFSYVKNVGRPLDIVKQEIEKLKIVLPNDVEISGVAVTGSGREYIADKIGATLTINEITAQTQGAVLFNNSIDTIFEIGGQDSKYMSVQNGKMTDFEMNKVCAAGTGAFLEEQIAKLGITMSEFLDYALTSETPCELGNRCTVFIESSITKSLSDGRSMQDVCAGLAYAIASNYLNRVVNMKPIGDNIAIQGGIAYNEAVVCAFRALTEKEVNISKYFSVTGALGAASLCLNKSYLVFDKEKNQKLNASLLNLVAVLFILNTWKQVL